jgi:uncharacterized protein YdeI (YjbR/CyaY-like superfamily)
MNKTSPKVDGFLRKEKRWQKELGELRRIVLECGLNEDVKWRQPCYTSENRNIVLIHGFKEYCALLFFKGALLKDANCILVKIGEHTQAGRQIRFTNVREIVEMEPVLKAYIGEAIAVEKSGLKLQLKKTSEYKIPDEFQSKLNKIASLKAAFKALTPGRQRAYILYFSSAKQVKTREARVEKCLPRILKGKGLDDE